MRQLYLSSLIFFFFLAFLHGDTLFVKVIGESTQDEAHSICLTEGGFAITGNTNILGNSTDLFLMKIDSSGNLIWSRVLGGEMNDVGVSVASLQGIIGVCGWTNSFGAGGRDIFVAKVDSSGELLWAETIGGEGDDFGKAILPTQQGGFFVLGWTENYGAGGEDIFLIKLDSLGNILWAKTYGGELSDYGYSLLLKDEGEIVIVGRTKSFSVGETDLLLIEVDSTGTPLFAKSLGGVRTDYGNSLALWWDNGIVVAGETDSYGTRVDEVFLVKFDSLGNLIWAKAIGGESLERASSVLSLEDSTILVTGFTKSFGVGGADIFLLKLDPLGALLWAKTVGGSLDDYGEALCTDREGNLVACGYTSSFGSGDLDVIFVKLSPSGLTCMGTEVSPNIHTFTLNSSNPNLSVGTPSPVVQKISPLFVGYPFPESTLCEIPNSVKEKNLASRSYRTFFWIRGEKEGIWIFYELAEPSPFVLRIFDLSGRKIEKRLFHLDKKKGKFFVHTKLRKGIYFVEGKTPWKKALIKWVNLR